MTEVFGADYADSYDALYADKDYGAECDLVEEIFKRGGRPIRCWRTGRCAPWV